MGRKESNKTKKNLMQWNIVGCVRICIRWLPSSFLNRICVVGTQSECLFEWDSSIEHLNTCFPMCHTLCLLLINIALHVFGVRLI